MYYNNLRYDQTKTHAVKIFPNAWQTVSNLGHMTDEGSSVYSVTVCDADRYEVDPTNINYIEYKYLFYC